MYAIGFTLFTQLCVGLFGKCARLERENKSNEAFYDSIKVLVCNNVMDMDCGLQQFES